MSDGAAGTKATNASVPLGPGMPRAVEGVLGGLRPGRGEGEGPAAQDRPRGSGGGGGAGEPPGGAAAADPRPPCATPVVEGGGGVAFRFVGRSHSYIGRAHSLMQ